jgi:hypothetical protein
MKVKTINFSIGVVAAILAGGAGYDGSIEIQADRITIGPGGAGIRRHAKTEVIH